MFNKLKNKKVNFFGKSVSVFVIAMIAFAGLGSAALVAYLSNPITGNVVVNSPMKLEITGDGCTDNTCELNFYGGESKTLDATTTKLTSGNTGNMLVEINVSNFDREGIDLETIYPGDITFTWGKCTSGVNAYYYFGYQGIPFGSSFNWDDEEEGFSESSQLEITTDLALEPDEYTFEAKVIKASERACTPTDYPSTGYN